jgi:thioesterase domain-containing protein
MVQELVSSYLSPGAENGRSLVPLGAGGPGSPLFCIHGFGGHIAAFVPLARQLAPARPVYGLQAQGLDVGQRLHTRVEDMAVQYAHEIRAVQPHGPYLLSGWSLGGLIASDVAHRLVQAGERVQLLAMLDTYLSVTDDSYEDPDDASVIRRIAPQLNVSRKDLRTMPVDNPWEFLAEKAGFLPGYGAATIRRLVEVCKGQLEAMSHYTPRPYGGATVLFRVGNSHGKEKKRWKALHSQLTIESVPGDHYTMLRAPAVEVLADRLSHHLRSTETAPMANRTTSSSDPT